VNPLVGPKDVGIVFKRDDGTTYTNWWSRSGDAWRCPLESWIKDQLYLEKSLKLRKIKSDRIMCIVRSEQKIKIERETNGQRARRVLTDRLGMWKGKTLDQMTDDECYECLRFVEERTGIYYL